MSNLKPCPFCGSKDVSVTFTNEGSDDDNKKYADGTVQCENCFANCGSSHGYVSMLTDHVTNKWNLRAA